MLDPVTPRDAPFSAPGGPAGVLVLHGFTGNPSSVRSLAEAFAGAGFAVEAPLLPGHGTTPEDLMATGWPEWQEHVDAVFDDLAARCDRVVVAGLSLGGTLACSVAARRGGVAGLVCINPFVEPVADSFVDLLRGLLDAGVTSAPAIGADIAAGGAGDGDGAGSGEEAYAEAPLAPLLSMCMALPGLAERLGDVVCPLLLFTSRVDHVVPPSSSDFLAARVGGPVERVSLENSYHVATLDADAAEIERRAVAFALSCVEARPAGESASIRDEQRRP